MHRPCSAPPLSLCSGCRLFLECLFSRPLLTQHVSVSSRSYLDQGGVQLPVVPVPSVVALVSPTTFEFQLLSCGGIAMCLPISLVRWTRAPQGRNPVPSVFAVSCPGAPAWEPARTDLSVDRAASPCMGSCICMAVYALRNVPPSFFNTLLVY